MYLFFASDTWRATTPDGIVKKALSAGQLSAELERQSEAANTEDRVRDAACCVSHQEFLLRLFHIHRRSRLLPIEVQLGRIATSLVETNCELFYGLR